MIGKTIRDYSIELTSAQAEAMWFADAVGLQKYYAASCDLDGDTGADFLSKHHFSLEQAMGEIAAAKASAVQGENVTLVAGSRLESDVIDGLEVITEGSNALITGKPRCQVLRALVSKMRMASAANVG